MKSHGWELSEREHERAEQVEMNEICRMCTYAVLFTLKRGMVAQLQNYAIQQALFYLIATSSNLEAWRPCAMIISWNVVLYSYQVLSGNIKTA